MILRLLLMDAGKVLRDAGVQGGERDVRLLFAFVDGSDVGRINTELDHVLDWSDGKRAAFDDMINLRASGVPVAKIIGRKAFWKGEFLVNFDVLDPRPDTETLIEVALQDPFTRVLDLGTGSGCILISLLMERANATGVGVDISDNALAVARENAALHNCEAAADFQTSNWFENVEGSFDLIVSNPPYIAANEMAGLDKDVRGFDPAIALTDGADGLGAYRIIAAGAAAHMTDRARLILEIGYTQASDVTILLADQGFVEITTHQDLNGRDRVICARKPRLGPAFTQ